MIQFLVLNIFGMPCEVDSLQTFSKDSTNNSIILGVFSFFASFSLVFFVKNKMLFIFIWIFKELKIKELRKILISLFFKQFCLILFNCIISVSIRLLTLITQLQRNLIKKMALFFKKFELPSIIYFKKNLFRKTFFSHYFIIV